ncbi:hypothetical protein B5X24_HaOG213506 [Helicoverpa armigera]|uniref:C2H2-type domain-containing protein n=1 Tax=Helicoverpa armigera TaxID=29058 RepID=A0A2W1BF46_HELAM|nr:hypothetical protein B5X24_HaOG213506 [Helicoverpa armigera]
MMHLFVGAESERLICATCVVRLRDARAFRRQVLHCEEKLLNAALHIHDYDENAIKLEVEVKQEEDSGHVNESDDDDHDDGVDPMDETSGQDEEGSKGAELQLKAEEAREQLSPLEGASVDKAKTEMLDKLNSMKKKLDKMQNCDEPRRIESPPYKRPVTIDKDLHILRNAAKIVENSYVCPFVTVFSDYHCIYCKEMFLDPTLLRQHTMTHDPKTCTHYSFTLIARCDDNPTRPERDHKQDRYLRALRCTGVSITNFQAPGCFSARPGNRIRDFVLSSRACDS